MAITAAPDPDAPWRAPGLQCTWLLCGSCVAGGSAPPHPATERQGPGLEDDEGRPDRGQARLDTAEHDGEDRRVVDRRLPRRRQPRDCGNQGREVQFHEFKGNRAARLREGHRMSAGSPAAMQATDDTVGLIWHELVDTDRMCRYYGYLAQRLAQLGELLQVGVAAAPLVTIATLLSGSPAWVPAAAAAGRYPHRAEQSAEIWRQLGRQQLEWEQLWNGIRANEDAELMSAWKTLRECREAILERAPAELPLSRALARRSQREACEHWRRVIAASEKGARASAAD